MQGARATVNGLPRFGILLLVIGTVWILQGVGLLPGSFMTGQIEWAVYGAMTAAAGLVLFRFRRSV